MFKETVIRFFQAATQSPELRQGLVTSQDLRTVVQMAADRGFQFSEEDLKIAVQTLQTVTKRNESELSDTDLDQLSGGIWMNRLDALGQQLSNLINVAWQYSY